MALVFVDKVCIKALSNNSEGMNAPENGPMSILKNSLLTMSEDPLGVGWRKGGWEGEREGERGRGRGEREEGG